MKHSYAVCFSVGEGKTVTEHLTEAAFLYILKMLKIPGYTFISYLGKGAFGAALLVERNYGK